MLFALSAHKLVKPRMNVEKELTDQPDLIPMGAEMLLSIAKLITKLNLRSTNKTDESILACDYLHNSAGLIQSQIILCFITSEYSIRTFCVCLI